MLHFGTSAIFLAGAVHYYLIERRPAAGASSAPASF